MGLGEVEYYMNSSGVFTINGTAPIIFKDNIELRTAALYLGILFVAIGVVGNAITIISLSFSDLLKKATTPFLINLCVADFLYCTFTTPMEIVTLWNGKWILGYTVCVLYGLSHYFLTGVSLFTMTGLAVNRYILIVHPDKYKYIESKKGVCLGLAIVYVSLFLIEGPSMLQLWGMFGYDEKLGMGDLIPVNGRSAQQFLYAVSFFVPTPAYVLCYIRIYMVVRLARKKVNSNVMSMAMHPEKNADQFCCLQVLHSFRSALWPTPAESLNRNRSKKAKDTHLLRMILIIYCLYFFGHVIPMILIKIHKEDVSVTLRILGYMLKHAVKCLNPIIYVIMCKSYRRAYLDLFSCYRNTENKNRYLRRKLSLNNTSST